MSRHRAVKNLDLADELDDGAFDGNDDYYEDMTSEQQAQMAQAFSQVQAVLGTDSPISDKQIRDALWDSYFDVDGSIAHLLDEQHKKEVRKQKEQGEALSPQSRPPPATGDLVDNLGADTDMHNEGAAVMPQDKTVAPPTAALASLSIQARTPSSTSASADGEGGLPEPAPKNKLAAKMAANKAKRTLAAPAAAAAAAAAAVGAGTADGALPESAAESAGASQQQQRQQPEKKLSKLQQKMLAAKAAKATAAAATASSDSAPGVAVPAGAIAPGRTKAESGAAGVSSSARPPPPPPSSLEETPDALPLVLDGLPSRTSAAATASEGSSEVALSAGPSAFASALAPAAGPSPAVRMAVPALSTLLAPTTPVLFGPSPDDKVLEARKGTALAGAGTGTGSRTNGTGTGAGGSRRPIGVAVPGAGRR